LSEVFPKTEKHGKKGIGFGPLTATNDKKGKEYSYPPYSTLSG